MCSLPPLYVVILMRAIRRHPSYSLVLPHEKSEGVLSVVKKGGKWIDRHTRAHSLSHFTQPIRGKGDRGESGYATPRRLWSNESA